MTGQCMGSLQAEEPRINLRSSRGLLHDVIALPFGSARALLTGPSPSYIQNMLGCVDAGFEAIHAIALNAAING